MCLYIYITKCPIIKMYFGVTFFLKFLYVGRYSDDSTTDILRPWNERFLILYLFSSEHALKALAIFHIFYLHGFLCNYKNDDDVTETWRANRVLVSWKSDENETMRPSRKQSRDYYVIICSTLYLSLCLHFKIIQNFFWTISKTPTTYWIAKATI